MKTREKQRANRRAKEELISLVDTYGVYNPTPYLAVKALATQSKKAQIRKEAKYGIQKYAS